MSWLPSLKSCLAITQEVIHSLLLPLFLVVFSCARMCSLPLGVAHLCSLSVHRSLDPAVAAKLSAWKDDGSSGYLSAWKDDGCDGWDLVRLRVIQLPARCNGRACDDSESSGCRQGATQGHAMMRVANYFSTLRFPGMLLALEFAKAA
jgi:hypothetical protein